MAARACYGRGERVASEGGCVSGSDSLDGLGADSSRACGCGCPGTYGAKASLPSDCADAFPSPRSRSHPKRAFSSPEEEARAAQKKAIALLEVRERSSKDLRARLVACGFSAEAADAALSFCMERHLQSDQRFAESLVRSKLAAGWSEARIARELAGHDIALADVRGYPEDFRTQSELERAVALLEKRFADRPPAEGDAQASWSERRQAEERHKARMCRFLASKGFSSETVYAAVARFRASS